MALPMPFSNLASANFSNGGSLSPLPSVPNIVTSHDGVVLPLCAAKMPETAGRSSGGAADARCPKSGGAWGCSPADMGTRNWGALGGATGGAHGYCAGGGGLCTEEVCRWSCSPSQEIDIPGRVVSRGGVTDTSPRTFS